MHILESIRGLTCAHAAPMWPADDALDDWAREVCQNSLFSNVACCLWVPVSSFIGECLRVCGSWRPSSNAPCIRRRGSLHPAFRSLDCCTWCAGTVIHAVGFMWAYASGSVTAAWAVFRHGGATHTSLQMPRFFPIGPRLAMHPRLRRLMPHVLNANMATQAQPQTQPGQQQQGQQQQQRQQQAGQAGQAPQPAGPLAAPSNLELQLAACHWGLDRVTHWLSSVRQLQFFMLMTAQLAGPLLDGLSPEGTDSGTTALRGLLAGIALAMLEWAVPLGGAGGLIGPRLLLGNMEAAGEWG